MKLITANQLRKFQTIVSKQKIDEETTRTMIGGFSGGRTLSSRGLFVNEAAAIIQHIEQLSMNNEQLTAIAKMKGKIFYYAHEMHWTKLNAQKKRVADGARIDEWMLKYSYLKKKLDNYTYTELPKLVTQFENVYKHFLKAL